MAGSATVLVTNDQPDGGIGTAARLAVGHLTLLEDNKCLATGGLTTATTTSQAKTVNTITYTIDGQFKSKSATDNLFVLAAAPAMSAGQTQKWLCCLDASGTASTVAAVTAQRVLFYADVVGADGYTYPAPGPSLCIVGQITVLVNSSTFTPGTTALSAGTITTTFRNGYEALVSGAAIPVPRG